MSLPNRSLISDFDAHNKIDSASIPPAVQNQDWSNPKLARAISDVAALGNTAPRFWCRLTLNTATNTMVLNTWHAVWENCTITTPVIARTTTGIFTITLPTVVSNDYDASLGTSGNITLNLLAASCSLEGATAGFVNCSASANIITIHSLNASGNANDLANTVILVLAY